MKNSIFIILGSLIGIITYSCGEKKEPTPVDIIDSTLLKPKIEFEYHLLDSGGVRFINKTKHIKSAKWWTSWYKSDDINPTFYFEDNSRYGFILETENEKGLENDTTFYIDITNAPLKIQKDRFTLNGIIYGEKFNLSSLGTNDFYGGGLASLPLGTPSARFNTDGISILIADFMPAQGVDYQTMLNNFKVGNQTLAQKKSYPSSDYSLNRKGWYLLIQKDGYFYATGNSDTDSLEILEVEEFRSRKLFPEMDERGFWVKWNIKAETEKSKIDCVIKTKYIIYETPPSMLF